MGFTGRLVAGLGEDVDDPAAEDVGGGAFRAAGERRVVGALLLLFGLAIAVPVVAAAGIGKAEVDAGGDARIGPAVDVAAIAGEDGVAGRGLRPELRADLGFSRRPIAIAVGVDKEGHAVVTRAVGVG